MSTHSDSLRSAIYKNRLLSEISFQRNNFHVFSNRIPNQRKSDIAEKIVAYACYRCCANPNLVKNGCQLWLEGFSLKLKSIWPWDTIAMAVKNLVLHLKKNLTRSVGNHIVCYKCWLCSLKGSHEIISKTTLSISTRLSGLDMFNNQTIFRTIKILSYLIQYVVSCELLIPLRRWRHCLKSTILIEDSIFSIPPRLV